MRQTTKKESNSDSTVEIKQDFLKEANQLAQTLDQTLANLTVASLKDNLEDLYSIFHTLKGNSRLIGQNEMQDLFHALGILLLDVRDFSLQPNEEIVSILRDSQKVLSSTLKMYAQGRVARIQMNNFRQRVLGASIPPENKSRTQETARQAQYFHALGIDEPSKRMIDFQDGSSQFFEVCIVLEETVFLKKTRVYTIIRNLTMLDESVRFGKINPSIENLLEGKFGLEFMLILQSTKSAEKLKEIIKLSDEIAEVRIKIIPTRDMAMSMK